MTESEAFIKERDRKNKPCRRGGGGSKGNGLPHVSQAGNSSNCSAIFREVNKDSFDIKPTESSAAAKELSLHAPPLGETLSDWYKRLGLR